MRKLVRVGASATTGVALGALPLDIAIRSTGLSPFWHYSMIGASLVMITGAAMMANSFLRILLRSYEENLNTRGFARV